MRIGVIGTGNMGINHTRVYSSLKDRCQLIGVYDANHQLANKVADEFGILAFKSLGDLLVNVDAVSITVPTAAHCEVGVACLNHKIHVLMEKPIAETISQAQLLIDTAHKMDVILQIGHIELFNPTINVLKKILANENLIAFDIHRMGPQEPRNQFADVIQDLMIHDIYILQYLVGEEIDVVLSLGRNFFNTSKYVSSLLRFKNGVIAQLTGSQVTEEKVRMIRIITQKAFIQADLLDRKIVISRSTNFFMEKNVAGYSQQNIMEKVLVPVQEPLRMQLIHFIDCIDQRKQPLVTGNDGLAALLVAEKIRSTLLTS